MPNRDIIVMGASMGGVEVLSTLVNQLPPDLSASVFVILHVSSTSPSVLDKILDRVSPLPVKQASDGESVQPGVIYTAVPDHHMILSNSHIRLTKGPRENRSRPAIDPLFRSAALHYGPRVIGIVLSGYLDDGTSGLAAIKDCGGVAVVQDPEDAAYPDMPKNALAHVKVDYCVPVREMGALLDRLTREPIEEPIQSDNPLSCIRTETEVAEKGTRDIADTQSLGVLSSMICPECGGALWEIRTEPLLRYRCHVGHAYTAQNLLADQDNDLNRALWAALRTLEDRCRLLQKMSREERARGRHHSADLYDVKRKEEEEHINKLRELLYLSRKDILGEE